MAHCGECGTIGCKACLASRAAGIRSTVPPEYYEHQLLSKPELICERCYPSALAATQSQSEPITTTLAAAIVVRSSRIRSFELIRSCGEVRFQPQPDGIFREQEATRMLLYAAIRAGGNAVYNYRLTTNREEVRKGYSRNGNPYYGTEVTRILTGEAVLHKRRA